MRTRHIVLGCLGAHLLGCNSDPCKEQPDSIFCVNLGGSESESGGGETGTPPLGECIPLDEDNPLPPIPVACQGIGNGWVVLDVFGDGVQPPECVNWGGERPANPTIDDCVPLDLTMLPNDIPSPGACCTEAAVVEEVSAQCMGDCAYAACKLAVAKLREAADALPRPDSGPIEAAAETRVRDDLYGFANLLEMPQYMDFCAGEVKKVDGGLAEISLGAGMSPPDLLGHVQDATLSLQCALDMETPHVFADTGSCDSTPNTPTDEGGPNFDGIAVAGSVAMSGPGGNASTPLFNINFQLREVTERGGATRIDLLTFEADVVDVQYGGFSFIDPHLHLVAPTSATLIGETLEFPAGSLRLAVSAVVGSNGQLLFEGQRRASTYTNTGPAIASRKLDGTFAFIDARFEAAGQSFVLNTEAGPTARR